MVRILNNLKLSSLRNLVIITMNFRLSVVWFAPSSAIRRDSSAESVITMRSVPTIARFCCIYRTQMQRQALTRPNATGDHEFGDCDGEDLLRIFGVNCKL